MDIQLYNTLSRQKEVFIPIKKGQVSMYNCGPTVYNTPHIGNYRTFVMNDLIRRLFEYNDYAVDQVMNITDVDDKTIRGSREEKLSLHDFTRKYEALFLQEIQSLNIQLPQHITRATEYIHEMIDLTSKLLEKGVAYKASDGIYMNIDKVKNYGELAHLDLTKQTKERITNDEYDKENPRDFALWKFHTEEDGDVVWEAPFGGRDRVDRAALEDAAFEQRHSADSLAVVPAPSLFVRGELRRSGPDDGLGEETHPGPRGS